MTQVLVLFRPSTGSDLTIPVAAVWGMVDKPLDHGQLEVLKEIYFPGWVIDQVLSG